MTSNSNNAGITAKAMQQMFGCDLPPNGNLPSPLFHTETHPVIHPNLAKLGITEEVLARILKSSAINANVRTKLKPSEIKVLYSRACILAIDIAKKECRVFGIAGEEMSTCEAFNVAIKTSKMYEYLKFLPPGSVVSFESCATSNRLGRYCLEHDLVPLIFNAAKVKAVRAETCKSDAADARAIYQTTLLYLQDPSCDIQPVVVRTEEDQGMQSLVTLFDRATAEKTAASNSLLALLLEFTPQTRGSVENQVKQYLMSRSGFVDGVVAFIRDDLAATIGIQTIDRATAQAMDLIPQNAEKLIEEIPLQLLSNWIEDSVALSLITSLRRFRSAEQQVEALKELITVKAEKDEDCCLLDEIRGVGPISSFALVALLRPAMPYLANANAACCYVGTCPRHTGTGGKTNVTHVYRGRNGKTRRILYEGALSIVRLDCNKPGTYAHTLSSKNTPSKSIACAYSNKIVRIAFTMLRERSHFDWSKENPLTRGLPERE